MSAARILALALAAALVACGDAATTPIIGFSQPSAVAIFRGVTVKRPGVVHPYAAVVNAGRSDLTLLDAWDDTPVLAPLQIRALQVPLPFARPTLVASGSLWDGTDGGGSADTPDLLVVAAPGSDTIELVRTWAEDNAIDAGQQARLPAGAEIVALAVIPVPNGAAKTPGRARVVAALTGARLGVVEYERAEGGAIRRVGAEPVAVEQPLAFAGVPFDAVSLAVAPDLPARIFVASPDPIGTVLGVAELDASGAPGSWTVVRALDARAPTRVVAATRLRERTADGSGEPHESGMFGPECLRVYAALDPAFCGPEQRVSCGIAVLSPDVCPSRGMLADYALADRMPYLAPILLPGQAVGITIAKPPARPPPDDDGWLPEYMTVRPETGARGTTAVAAVPSTDGRIYYVDLGRWAVPLSESILRTDTRTRVTLASASRFLDSPRQLGLWLETSSGVELVTDPARLAQAVVVTPGFTRSETWRLRYQGLLPGLAGPTGQEGHRGETGRTPTGETWLALQVAEPAGDGGETLTQVVRLYDPALGVRTGDVVSVVLRPGALDGDACPLPQPGQLAEPVEATVASLLPPDADRPGGAVVLAPTLTDPRLLSADPNVVAQADDWPGCVAALADGTALVDVQVRAGGMVLTGDVTGHALRPALQLTEPGSPPSFPPSGPGRGAVRVEYSNEDLIACPVYPWPADLAQAPPEFFSCTDDTCRRACERLVLVRKARRLYHLAERCRTGDIVDVDCNRTWWGGYTSFPRQSGPVIAFTPGYVADPADPGGVLPVGDPALRAVLRRLEIAITTDSGISLTARSSGSASGVAPASPGVAATFDRSVAPGGEPEGYRFFVPYPSGYVYDFSPSEPLGTAKVVR